MSELPKGWRERALSDMLAQPLANGRSVPTADDGFPVLRLTALRDGRIDLSEAKIGAWTAKEAHGFLVSSGDMLVSRGNGSLHLVGRAGLVGEVRAQVAFPDTLIRVRPRLTDCEPRFLVAQWNGPEVRSQLERAAKTTAGIYKVSQGDLSSLVFAVPPLEEQRRIVAKLEALQARSRRARAALDAVPPLLEKLRQSILAAAFRGDLTKDWRAKNTNVEPASKLLERIRAERRKKWEESELAKMKAKGKPPADDKWRSKYKEPEPVDATGLPELPGGWCWVSLGEVAWDAGYGTSAKCDYDGAGIAVLRIPNVSRGVLSLTDVKRARVDLNDATMVVAPGDMLIVRTNGSRDLIGRAAVVTKATPEPASFASYLIRFRLVSLESLFRWVGRYWQSPSVRRLVEGHAASSAGQYNVSLRELSSCPVPLAPPEEQERLLDIVDSLLSRELGTETSADAARMQIQTLERAILAKAFRGELVAQDGADQLSAVPSIAGAARPNEPPARPRKRKAS